MRLPLPQVVPDTPMGGNVIGVMNAINSNRMANKMLQQQDIRNMVAQQTLPYQAQLAAANALSKAAFANTAPAQVMANLANNPQIWNSLTPEQQHLFGQHLANTAMMSGNVMSMLPRPMQFQQSVSHPGNPISQYIHGGFQSSPIGRFVSNVFGRHKTQKSQMPDSYNPISNQQNITPQSYYSPSLSSQPDQEGSYIVSQPPGSAENLEQRSKYYDAAVTKSAENEQNLRQNELKDMNEQSNNASTLLNELTTLKNLYPKMNFWEKGGLEREAGGITKHFEQSDARKLYDRIAPDIVARYASNIINNRHLGIGAVDYFKSAKPDRTLGDESHEDLINEMMVPLQRTKEYQKFVDQSLKKYPESKKNDRDLVWQRYINDMPIYDPSKSKVLTKNLNRWGEYLDPKVWNAVLNNQKTPIKGITGPINYFSNPSERNNEIQSQTKNQINNKLPPAGYTWVHNGKTYVWDGKKSVLAGGNR